MQIYKASQVSVTISDGNASGTGTIPAGFTNLAKMVVFGTWTLPALSNITGDKSFVKLTVTNTTTLTAERIGSTSAGAINVEAYVVQFGDDTNIYKGTFSMAAGTGTVSVDINSGNPMTLNDIAKAFIWSYWTSSDTTSGDDWSAEDCLIASYFASATQATFKRYATTTSVGAISGNFFVVESSTLSVQHETYNYSSTTATTLTDVFTTDVTTLAHTFILGSYFQIGKTWLSDRCWVTDFNNGTSTTTARFRRYDVDGTEGEFRYQVITDAGIDASRDEFTHNATSNTATISVDMSRTIPIPNGSGHPLHTKNDDYDPGHQDEYANKMWISNSTTLNVASTNAGGNMTLPWQVIQFTAESAPATRRIFIIS